MKPHTERGDDIRSAEGHLVLGGNADSPSAVGLCPLEIPKGEVVKRVVIAGDWSKAPGLPHAGLLTIIAGAPLPDPDRRSVTGWRMGHADAALHPHHTDGTNTHRVCRRGQVLHHDASCRDPGSSCFCTSAGRGMAISLLLNLGLVLRLRGMQIGPEKIRTTPLPGTP